MIKLSDATFFHDGQFAAGNVADVDIRLHRATAAVQLNLLAELHVDHRPRDDLEQLLPRAVNVRGSHRRQREAVLLLIDREQHVGRRLRSGIRRARVHRRRFGHIADARPVHLGRRNVDVLLEIRLPPQVIHQLGQRDGVRPEPMLRMIPTRRHLALRREVDDVIRLFGIEQCQQLRHVAVQVERKVSIAIEHRPRAILEKQRAALRTTTDAEDFVPRVVEQEIDEVLTGE